MPDTRPPASKNLVTTDWLAARLGEPEISIVDGSFYLPALKRDAKAEYLAGHIPGAVFFDIDAIADHSTDLPHMLPGATQFAKDVGALGIGNDDTIVVYDGVGPRRRAAGVVDVPHLRRQEGLHPRRRPAEMEGRRPPDRVRRAQAHAAQVRGRAEHRASSPASPTCRWRCSTSPPRWSTRGRPTASAAKRRSRGRACAPATCRARSTCRSPA